MIVGHGIDLQDMRKIAKLLEKNDRLPKKILTAQELEHFEGLKGKNRLQFISGRWSAKEAFAKAWGTGIGRLSFQDLEVLPNELGAPVFTRHPFSAKVWVSISHSGDFVQASVILEEGHD